MTEEETAVVTEYIDSIITCEMPNAVVAPFLRSLVEKYQIHKCKQTCFKRGRGGKKLPYCRFGYHKVDGRPVRYCIN